MGGQWGPEDTNEVPSHPSDEAEQRALSAQKTEDLVKPFVIDRLERERARKEEWAPVPLHHQPPPPAYIEEQERRRRERPPEDEGAGRGVFIWQM